MLKNYQHVGGSNFPEPTISKLRSPSVMPTSTSAPLIVLLSSTTGTEMDAPTFIFNALLWCYSSSTKEAYLARSSSFLSLFSTNLITHLSGVARMVPRHTHDCSVSSSTWTFIKASSTESSANSGGAVSGQSTSYTKWNQRRLTYLPTQSWYQWGRLWGVAILEPIAKRQQGICGLPKFAARLDWPPASRYGPEPQQWISTSKAVYSGARWPFGPLSSGPEPVGLVLQTRAWTEMR